MVIVNFTVAQAKALRLAAGEVMEAPDAVSSLFYSSRDVMAAKGAYEKLTAGAVEFSKAEAKALSFAAGNVMDHLDVVAEIFPTGPARVAATNAYNKLNKAAYGK